MNHPLWLLTLAMTLVAADKNEWSHLKSDHVLAAKPWYLKTLQYKGTDLYVSPVTLLIVTLVLVNIAYNFSKKSWAVASHILVDHSPNAKEQLEEYKKQIANDYAKFQKFARQHSTCPSKQAGGDLGRFKQGDMAPPFDRAVFYQDYPLNTTIGPIQTQFGWHLIYIRERTINETILKAG